MKFDIPVPCFYGRIDFCEALDRIKALGFDTVETYSWQSLDIPAVREKLLENNMTLLSICTSFFDMTDPAKSGEWLSNLEKSCGAAGKLGVHKMITQVGPDTGADRAVQHQSIVDNLIRAKDILLESGVTLMIEPLNVLVDHKGYYLPSSAEAFDIVREVDCKNVKVVYDIYHQQVTEGNIIPTIRNNIDLIAHFHCAGHPGRNDLQFGENDYRVIFSAIDGTGYDGFCGLEYSPLSAPENSLGEFRKIYMD